MTATARHRLSGWKVIAAYLRVSERAARRLARASIPDLLRLPVFRLSPEPNAPVCAHTDELAAWEQRVSEARRVVTR